LLATTLKYNQTKVIFKKMETGQENAIINEAKQQTNPEYY